MELIIGGAHQGKLDWYHREYGTDAAVAQGETVSLQPPPQQPVLNHLPRFLRTAASPQGYGERGVRGCR